jgi:nucleoside 2-deoxyribosyltransferase
METATIYLAGPIGGLNYSEAVDWRDETIRALEPYGIKGLSPMRGKEYLMHEAILKGTGYDDTLLSNNRAIVTRDRMDVTNSNAVLMNLLGATRVSIGSMVELGWADLHRIPTIVVMEQGNIHEHGFVYELANFVVDNIPDAWSIIKGLF